MAIPSREPRESFESIHSERALEEGSKKTLSEVQAIQELRKEGRLRTNEPTDEEQATKIESVRGGGLDAPLKFEEAKAEDLNDFPAESELEQLTRDIQYTMGGIPAIPEKIKAAKNEEATHKSDVKVEEAVKDEARERKLELVKPGQLSRSASEDKLETAGSLPEELGKAHKEKSEKQRAYLTRPEEVAKMQETIKEPIAPEWQAVYALQEDLRSKYNIEVPVGGLSLPGGKEKESPQESGKKHLEALQKLDRILAQFPKFALEGKEFKPGTHFDKKLLDRPSRFDRNRSDRAGKFIRYDANAPEEEIVHFFGDALGIGRVKGAPKRELEDDLADQLVQTLRKGYAPAEPVEASDTEPGAVKIAEPVTGPEKPQEESVPLETKMVKRENSEGAHNAKSIPEADNLQGKLDVARERYVKAKKDFEEREKTTPRKKAVITSLNIGADAHERLDKALEDARAEYKKARSEYIGADLRRYMHERNELLESHLREYGELDPSNEVKRKRFLHEMPNLSLYDLGKKLNWNVDKTKFRSKAYKALTVRRGINLVLLGLSGGAGYLGWTGTAGAMLIAKRAASGLFGGMATSRMLEQKRKNFQAYSEKQIEGLNFDDVELRLTQLEQEAFAGKTFNEIYESKEYQGLLNRQGYLIERMPADERERIFGDAVESHEKDVQQVKDIEKLGKRVTRAAGVMAGAAIGTAAEWLNNEPGYSAPLPDPHAIHPDAKDVVLDPDKTYGMESGAPASDMHGIVKPSSDVASHKEILPSRDIFSRESIPVSSYGVEGTLGALKDADPAKYQALINHAKEQFPGTTSEGALIHKVVAKAAEEKGFTVGGDYNDLNDIRSADLQVGPDGAIKIENVRFTSTANIIPESAEAHEVLEGDTPSADGSALANATEEGTLDEYNEGLEAAAQAEAENPTEILESKDIIGGESFASTIDSNLDLRKFDQLYRQYADLRPANAMIKMMGRKDFDAYVSGTLKLRGWDINRIGDMRVDEFIKHYNHEELPPKESTKLKATYELVKKYVDVRGSEAEKLLKQEPLKKILTRIAIERAKSRT
jgi:hypothetical protein